MVLLFTVCLVVAAIYLHHRWTNRRIYAIAKKLHGPAPWPIVGNGHLFMGSSEKVFNSMKKVISEYPRPTRVWLGPRLFVMLDHPDDVQCIVNSQNALYKDKVYKFLECLGGPGMITINGDMWRTHRKVLNPCFNMKILESYMPIFNKDSDILIENLDGYARSGETFNIEACFHACTLDIVLETTTGVSFNIQKNENREFLLASDVILNIVTDRMTKVWLHPEWIFKQTSNYAKQTASCKIVRRFIHDVLETTKKELERDKTNQAEVTNAEGDYERPQIYVNQMLKLSKADGTDDSFTDDEVIAEAITAIAAGNETSGLAIANTILMLAIHPDIQEKVVQELHDILPTADCEITADDLNKMVYLEWTLKESMRMYPLAPILLRYLTGDVQVGDLTLPAGCSVGIPVLTMHQRKDIWGEDADQFNPEHFNPDQHSKRNPVCFMPFGGGYRMCIGWKYAMMMMKTILAHSLRRYRFTTELRESEFRFQIDITMRLINKHLVKAERRVW